MSGSDDYEVGYAKPPVHTRFGAPNGNRPARGRTSRILKTDLLEELSARVTLHSNGKRVRLSQQRALVRSMVVRGIKGDSRATAKIFDLVLKIIGGDDGTADKHDLSAEDQAILDGFLLRRGPGDEA